MTWYWIFHLTSGSHSVCAIRTLSIFDHKISRKVPVLIQENGVGEYFNTDGNKLLTQLVLNTTRHFSPFRLAWSRREVTVVDCCNFTVDSASLSGRKMTGSGLVSLPDHLHFGPCHTFCVLSHAISGSWITPVQLDDAMEWQLRLLYSEVLQAIPFPERGRV